MHVTIVGERAYDKCYFRVKDVAKFFDAPNLSTVILNKERDGYIENRHFKFFNRIHSISDEHPPNTKVLYLTYTGLIRFLFASRNKKAEMFQDWAAKILFVHQVGTLEQRTKLVKNLLGSTITNVIETLNASVSEVSCIYLFVIGKVSDVKKNMAIKGNWNDDSYVCKFGETADSNKENVGENKK